MTHTKKNKESVREFNNNVDLTESLSWSLLQKRIGDNLNTLEETLSSGLSSSDILEPKYIFETFTLKTSNLGHFTTPNISQ
jgi:hypothetical protein